MPEPLTGVSVGAPTISLAAARQGRQAETGPAQEMNQEVFLKLLVTQLQNQDPASPMDTNEMVSQTAQLSMTETLNGISQTLKGQTAAAAMSTAGSLIGRQVDWLSEDATASSGTVTGAVFQNGQALLEVDGGVHTVTLARITALAAARPLQE